MLFKDITVCSKNFKLINTIEKENAEELSVKEGGTYKLKFPLCFSTVTEYFVVHLSDTVWQL
jgi:hypothetical protein